MLAALCVGLGTGALVDLRQRRVPNEVSLATTGIGFALAASGVSGITLTSALLGLVVGFVLMLPGHLLGATGAGDVKLFAAAGTLLGGGRIVPAFLCVAICGGILAVAIAWRRGRLARTVKMTAQLCGRGTEMKAEIESAAEHNRFPYAPAIAAGCLIAMLWR